MIFEILLSGFFIGILVSAPMGPIGILCIRRSLHKGRMEGFMSGVGAVISDLVYASITYLGVGIVVSFIEQNNPAFTILGSVLMMAFAYYLFRSKSSFDVKDDDSTSTNYARTIGSSFLLTFSNPLIIFFYIALFARFSIVPEDGRQLLGYFVAMMGIAAGALLWWWTITYLVAKLRDRITVVGLSWFNRTVSVIFAIVAIVGLISGISAVWP